MDYRVQRLVNDQEAGAYRYVVAGVGDVNGDGFTDVLIGEPIATIPGQKNGLVRLYFGGPQGLQPDMPNALQTINSPDDASSYFGGTVYGAGDVNGDGFADVVITSFGIQGATSRMRVYMGGTNGLQAPVMIDGTPGTSFFRPVGTGDINGDGYSDVFVGENTTVRNYRLGPTLRMYFGGPNGLQHVSDGMAAMFVGAGALDECFGCAVASGGDVDGDGYGEMIVSDGGATVNGYENVGQVFVFRGGPAGPTRLARYALIGDPQAGDGFSRFVH